MVTKASVPPATPRASNPRRRCPRIGRRVLPAGAGLAAAVLTAAFLAGCGSGSNGESGKGAGQIVKDAQKATMAASSVHVAGSGTSTTTPLKLDLVAGRGKGGGTITSGTTVLNLILDMQSIYIKADAATIQSLTGNTTTATVDANKWLQTSSTNTPLAGLSQLLDISKLPQSFTFRGVPTKQSATTFAGVAVIPVFDPQSGGTLYVATAGKPYIIGIKGAKSSGGAVLTFDHYGAAHVPPAPPNPVNLSG